MQPLVLLGQAAEIAFIGSDGKRRTKQLPAEYSWAWIGSPKAGHILLVRPLDGGYTPIFGKAAGVFARFHGKAPDQTWRVDAPTQRRPWTEVGRIISFAYDARAFSASKADDPYRHHFGAFEHDDRPPFDPRYYPLLVGDADNGVSIQRVDGNAFFLDEWVRG